MELHETILLMRKLKGHKQIYMGKCLGIKQQAYQLIESGKTRMNEKRLDEIAKILNTTPEAIRKGDLLSCLNNK